MSGTHEEVGCYSRSRSRLFHCVPHPLFCFFAALSIGCTGSDHISPKPLLDQVFVQVFALFTVASNCAPGFLGVDAGGSAAASVGRLFSRVPGKHLTGERLAFVASQAGREERPVNQWAAAAQGTEKIVFKCAFGRLRVVVVSLSFMCEHWRRASGLFSMARAKDLLLLHHHLF